jgi:hypothetical protein
MVDFRCREYSDGKGVADKETRTRIIKTGIRKMARLTGIHSDTIALIANGKSVKQSTLAKLIRFISETVRPAENKGSNPHNST